MEQLKRYYILIRTYAASMNWLARVLYGVLLVMIIGGGVWLVVSIQSAPPMTLVFDQPVETDRLADLRVQLDRRGIDYRIEAGRILARPKSHAAICEIVAGDGNSSQPIVSAMEKLADQDSIWRTTAQNDKRWQVAQMSALGQLVSALSPIRTATVMLQSGTPARIGRPRVPPSAMVQVSLHGDDALSDRFVCAISDIVSGSISGMDRQDVCIVDDAGRSYRSGKASVASAVSPAAEAIDRLRRSESYYTEKIRSALGFIDHAIINVRLDKPTESAGSLLPCMGVSVSIPRSYFEQVFSYAQAGRPGEDIPPVAEFIDTELAGIRRRVMQSVGIDDPQAISVEWHYDPASAGTKNAASHAAGILTWFSGTAAAFAGFCAAIVLVVLIRGRSGRRGGSTASSRVEAHRLAGDNIDEIDQLSADVGAEKLDEPFAFIRDMPGAQLLNLIRQEHPQTIAMVLSQLGPGKAAAVLAGLEPTRQVEIIRRISAMGHPDEAVSRELAHGLAQRIGRPPATGDGQGISAAAEILNQSGYDAKRSVLAGLSGDESVLADSIRGKIFEFGDIAALPQDHLRTALRSIETDEIAVALRTAGRDVRRKILSSMPLKRSRLMRRRMEQIGPVRLSDVEAAQQRLADVVCLQAVG